MKKFAILSAVLFGLASQMAFATQGAAKMTVDTVASPLWGASVYRSASFTEANVKATPGKLYGFHFINANAGVRYVQLYDSASTPVNGTTTVVSTFKVPASSHIDILIPVGQQFANGVGIGCTTDAAGATDATAAECIMGALWYK